MREVAPIPVDELVRYCKALADPQRLRILALCRAGEISVGELTDILGQSQPRVSQQLKLLCDAALLQRFRDGRRIYYRLPDRQSAGQRQLLRLIPESDAVFVEDAARLRQLRGGDAPAESDDSPAQRAIARALIDLTVAAPLGDLLDIGCGRGRLLKLLASRANRAVGVDLDARARRDARAELMLAGLPNCSLRHGDMYRLDFADASFDTIILDDVLATAAEPRRALAEARRLLKSTGRLLILTRIDNDTDGVATDALPAWSSEVGLRMSVPRRLPADDPQWLFSVMTLTDSQPAAA